MFDGDDDRADTRRSLLLLVALLGVPIVGVTGVFALAVVSIWMV